MNSDHVIICYQLLVTLQLTLTRANRMLIRISNDIQRYARKVFRGVLFLYVTVNVEPYGTVQNMLLWNKKCLTFDDLTTAFMNFKHRTLFNCSPLCRCTVRCSSGIYRLSTGTSSIVSCQSLRGF
jgi:hypothetical protein